MSGTTFQNCPRCRESLEAGFAAKAPGLSFVAPDKLEHFVFVDEDVAKAGFRKFLPSPAAYFRSYLCRSCELYIIDYSVSLDRAQANRAAETMTSAR
jgi:hypothetical protein